MTRTLLYFLSLYLNLFRARKDLEKIRLRKLKKLFAHARQNVPLYEELYKELEIELKDMSDISKIPVLNSSHFKEQSEDRITSQKFDKNSLLPFGTSGSSGKPFQFFVADEDFINRQLRMMRLFWLNGWRPWWKGVNVWRESVEKKGSFLDKVIDSRKTTVSIHWPLEKQAEAMVAVRPKLIYGITSTLDILAKWMIDNDKTIDSAKLVVSGGEGKTDDISRRFKRAFGHEGMNYYGANECGVIGWSCPRCGTCHFDDDGVIAEVVNKDYQPAKPGESGKVLITVLDQFSTPLIRYEIGDLISLFRHPSRCSIPFSQFESIVGREEDRIVLKDGRDISWQNVYATVIRLKGVEKIQFFQRKDGEVVVRFVPKQGFDGKDIERRISESLEIREKSDLRFEPCEAIPLEKSGKSKLIKRE